MTITVYDSSWRTLRLKNWPELEARSPTGMSKSLQPNMEFDFEMIEQNKCWNNQVKPQAKGMSMSLQPNVKIDLEIIKEQCWNDEVKPQGDVKGAAKQCDTRYHWNDSEMKLE